MVRTTMTSRVAFAVNWDYRCPFARNAHEHVVAGLRAGAPWDVTFVAFSLGQVHVEDGGRDVWDDPDKASGLLAVQAGIAVRDQQPEHFLDVHEALFAARHDEGLDIRDERVVRETVARAGADPDAVFADIAGGRPLKVFRQEHETWATERRAFGVPTFALDETSVFVRLVHRPAGDAELAVRTIDRVVDLLAWTELNEFKHTSISR